MEQEAFREGLVEKMGIGGLREREEGEEGEEEGGWCCSSV